MRVAGVVETVSSDDAVVPRTRLLEPSEAVKSVEETLTARLTTPAKPPRLVAAMLETSEEPTRIPRLVVVASSLKSTTRTLTVAKCERPLAVPLTVTV